MHQQNLLITSFLSIYKHQWNIIPLNCAKLKKLQKISVTCILHYKSQNMDRKSNHFKPDLKQKQKINLMTMTKNSLKFDHALNTDKQCSTSTSKLKLSSSFQTIAFPSLQDTLQSDLRFSDQAEQNQDHDIQLRSYISGQKQFKQQNFEIQKFSQETSKLVKLTHKKQKSKSFLGDREGISVKLKLLSNRNYTTMLTQDFVSKQNLKTQIESFQKKVPNHVQRNNKGIRYLDLNIQRSNNYQQNVLQMQQILKKVSKKHQYSIQHLTNKLSLLPKISHRNKNKPFDSTLHLFPFKNRNQPQKQLQAKQTITKTQKPQKLINMTASIMKLQQNKLFDLRRLEQSIILSKKMSNSFKKCVSRNQEKLNLTQIYRA